MEKKTNENIMYNYGELRNEIHRIFYDFYNWEREVSKGGEFDFEFMEYRTDDILRLISTHGLINSHEKLELPKTREPIFIDMDGTLAKWEETHIDEVMSPGYFSCREPIYNMIGAVKILVENSHPVYITSKVISGTTAVIDKDTWLDTYLPFIPKEYRFYIPYDAGDKNGIPLADGVQPYYVLVDDSTHYGLKGWKGVGIKVNNGINNTHRSWTGYMISTQSCAEVIANTISSIAALEKEKYNRVKSGI